uniref:Alpha-glucosidase n=1 Tax=Rhabditophanes sp. KR3021 TaxID=114890 RepID=A0AC35U707_9BILA
MSANDSLMSSSEGGVTKNVNPELGEVKFVNGNEEVDVNVQTKLIGLTKEQLEQYRNIPGWMYFRRFCFVLFWIFWGAMFFGAIAIVVFSPKCATKTDAKSYESSISYQMFVPTFKDTDSDGVGDFDGVAEKLDYLKKIGVESIWPSPIIKTDKNDFNGGAVVDFTTFDDRFGDENSLKKLIQATKEKGLKFVAEIPLSVSEFHPWAVDVKNNPNSPYRKYFSKVESRTLDLTNENVKKDILTAATKLVALGVDGIYLKNADHIDGISVRSLKESIIDAAENSKFVIFTYENDINNDEFHIHALITSDCNSINLAGCVINNINKGLASKKVIWSLVESDESRVDTKLNKNPAEAANLLTLLQLVLPGQSNIVYGNEFGLLSSVNNIAQHMPVMSWDSYNHTGFTDAEGALLFGLAKNSNAVDVATEFATSGSALKIFQKVAKLKNRDETLKSGMISAEVKNGLLYVYRYPEGKKGKMYILVLNLNADDKNERSVDLAHASLTDKDKTKVDVFVVSQGVEKYQARDQFDLNTEKIALTSMQGILLRV